MARLPSEKAEEFSVCFRQKWMLPASVSNFDSSQILSSVISRGGFLQLRSRNAKFHLSSLDPASATGPDGISTVLLRNVGSTICRAFAVLARRIVDTGIWPKIWKTHWVCPLHKKGPRSDAKNYRGLQITSQMSKAMERFLGMHFLNHLSFSGSFGSSQFAYRKFHGARDAVLFVTLTWLLAFALGNKIGVNCSDVAGAFGRVSTEKLIAKTRRSVIHSGIAKVIENWLIDRVGQVIVQGCTSAEFILRNMCFQGTVWGPSLWNLFFSDAPLALRKCAFKEIMYADDLNAYRVFTNGTSNDFVLGQLRRCQLELHEWGAANSVTFEQTKESFHILSHSQGYGDPFRLLGVTFDIQLSMGTAVSECSIESHWRLSSLLRSRRFFSVYDIVLHYKAHILSFLEYRTCAITHAADTHLIGLDSVQRKFLRNISVSPVDALQVFNLAPLSSRRDIANLGIIYRALFRKGPKQLQTFFECDVATRRSSPRFSSHNFQVKDNTRQLHKDFLNRSTFGYVAIFNLLPASVFTSPEYDNIIPVNEFQKNLNRLLKFVSCVDACWESLFNPRVEIYNHMIRDFQHVSREHLLSQ